MTKKRTETSALPERRTAGNRNRLSVVAAAIALMLMGAAIPAYSTEGTAADESLFVYELNMARWDPHSYGDDIGVGMPDDILPRPWLAIDTRLSAAASFRTDEMVTHGYVSHQSAVTGDWPNDVVRDHGYPLPSLFPSGSNNVESLYVGSSSANDALRALAASTSHRSHLFGLGWYGTHSEIGVGKSASANLWTILTAYPDPGETYVTGFVYSDDNRNRRMDLGEALAGVTVEIGDRITTSSQTGHFQIPRGDGRYIISAQGGAFVGESRARVTVKGFNVGVEFISGRRRPTVYGYDLCSGLEPTILGTDRADVIYGTPGADVIHGLGGRDTIYGLGGNDVICGGGSADTIFGGAGRDEIRGQGGPDLIKGGMGADTIFGGGGRDELLGQGGSDNIKGGGQNDRILGGAGNDLLNGQAGTSDRLNGGARTDTCRGGESVTNCER